MNPLRKYLILSSLLPFLLAFLWTPAVLLAAEENPREEILREIRSLERSAGFSPRDTTYINRLIDLAGAGIIAIGILFVQLSKQAVQAER